jgi:hypothetical protein
MKWSVHKTLSTSGYKTAAIILLLYPIIVLLIQASVPTFKFDTGVIAMKISMACALMYLIVSQIIYAILPEPIRAFETKTAFITWNKQHSNELPFDQTFSLALNPDNAEIILKRFPNASVLFPIDNAKQFLSIERLCFQIAEIEYYLANESRFYARWLLGLLLIVSLAGMFTPHAIRFIKALC